MPAERLINTSCNVSNREAYRWSSRIRNLCLLKSIQLYVCGCFITTTNWSVILVVITKLQSSIVQSRYKYIIIARRAFVWATLKFVCPFVRPATTADFGPVSSLCRSARDTIFGWHCQGIRDQLESTNQSVLQKHTYVAQHATCQKHTFWDQKSTTSKWSTFRKLTIFGSVL